MQCAFVPQRGARRHRHRARRLPLNCVSRTVSERAVSERAESERAVAERAVAERAVADE